VVEQIRERLDCAPEEALTLAEIKEGDPLPDAEAVDARIQRLTRERENIGAVNLRAEEEAAELDEQISTLITERADLEAAIQRLRQGIQSLNRDGRQRVTAAFKVIDGHFRSLFTRLYGGGHAHLELIESDDPLEAGLEILASPPGKKLQSLTLLSGGEKALTALALLFAVFLTNPAPICVLDEVDAPLDDSNVDRFCSLVAELAEKSGTRFVVVTHHRLTMSKVDRLYGVTMVERGVSQLVSVDLSEAEQWRQSA
jgi:chromosome segregation protein